MHLSKPFIAIGIGTALALSTATTARSQETAQDANIQTARLSLLADLTADKTPLTKPDQGSTATSATSFQLAQGMPENFAPETTAEASDELGSTPLVQSIEPQPEAEETEVEQPDLSNPEPSTEVEPLSPTDALPADDEAPSNEFNPTDEPASTDDMESESIDDQIEPQPQTVDDIDGDTTPPIPDYLNPLPNPLLTPTRPEQVDIVGIQPITLEQAIELALRNNQSIEVARLQLEQSRAQLRQARAALFPTLSLSSGLTVQENQQQQFQQINPLTGQLETVDVEQDDADTTLTGSVSLNYDLFTSGGRSAQIRASTSQVQFQELQLETQVADVVLDITNSYYDLQETDEQVRIAQASLAEAEQSLRDAQALERAGVGTRFDVLQAEVDVANFRQDLTQSISDQLVARRQLARQLNLAPNMEISAADPIEVAERWDLSLEESIVLAFRNRAELEQELLRRDIAQSQRRVALSQIGPQVSLFADYSVSDTLNVDSNTQDQYRFGAQLQWLLFDAGAARASADQEEANIAIAEAQYADTRDQIRLDVEQAYLSLQANFDNIQTATLALEQAREALRLARLRFQAGVGTQTDVLRQQTELAQSELNQLQAILGYNRSLVQLKRAISNLPDGILTNVPEESP